MEKLSSWKSSRRRRGVTHQHLAIISRPACPALSALSLCFAFRDDETTFCEIAELFQVQSSPKDKWPSGVWWDWEVFRGERSLILFVKY